MYDEVSQPREQTNDTRKSIMEGFTDENRVKSSKRNLNTHSKCLYNTAFSQIEWKI